MSILAVLVNCAIQLFAIKLSIASTELCELVLLVYVLLLGTQGLCLDTFQHILDRCLLQGVADHLSA